MENRINIELYNYKKMQEMLPDYIFGRLSESEKVNFEKSIDHFPDLQEEIKDVSSVFNKLNAMDLDSKFDSKTRNLSVKVMDKLHTEGKQLKFGRFSYKYLVPAIALVVFGIAMFLNSSMFKNIFTNSKQNDNYAFNIKFTDKEIKEITDSSISKNDIINLSSHLNTDSYQSSTKSSLDEIISIDKYLSKLILEEIIEKKPNFSYVFNNSSFTYINITDDLNEIEETEFQKILKELENADFSS